MSQPTVYLISGANRGIGKGLVASLLTRPNTTIIAGARDPQHATAQGLQSLPTASGSRVIVVKLDSLSDTDAATAATILPREYGINHIDIVIANAGIAKSFNPAAQELISEVRDHFEVNVLGPLRLFQATLPLLQKAAHPVFVLMGTLAGTMGIIPDMPFPATAYGSSKVAAHFVTRMLARENPKLVIFVIHPGWVQSDMGNSAATARGMKEAPVTMQQSIDGILAKVDAADEKMTGTFQSFDGNDYVW